MLLLLKEYRLLNRLRTLFVHWSCSRCSIFYVFYNIYMYYTILIFSFRLGFDRAHRAGRRGRHGREALLRRRDRCCRQPGMEQTKVLMETISLSLSFFLSRLLVVGIDFKGETMALPIFIVCQLSVSY